jgi:Holliday junction resolvase RusA-like endonuclease
MQNLLIEVFGDPASQGSHSVFNGRIVQVNSPKHKRWRNAVTFAALDLLPPDWTPIDEAVEVEIIFYLPRPATVSFSKREFPSVMPDIDKLARSVLDSITDSGLWTDDSRVIRLLALKRYADARGVGAVIKVNTLPTS